MLNKSLPDSPLLRLQASWLSDYKTALRMIESGIVVSVGDGIAWIRGLPSAAIDEILEFEDGSQGVVFDLTEELVGAILLRDTQKLTAGTLVRIITGSLVIPVGDELLGRVVDPLGLPLDGESVPDCSSTQPLDSPSPPIIARDFVHQPLYTGIKIVDTMIPIGKGQRQLLIGDEGLGRTSIAVDTLLNQMDNEVICIYVMIGQKRSTVVNTIETLRRLGALAYTVMVVAEANSLPGLQHLAPFAACAVAEYWMYQGRDTLIVYDDLSTHAKNYRQLSLLLRRPPGREAYPGDIFSIHARLLERSTCLNAEHGGGSMTALPIVETTQGEISSYIPTNLISITDGQIFLDRNLFTSGFRPAIDIARSVSRIGGNAQHPRIKEEAGRMKLDFLQYIELEIFTRFGARLEVSMQAIIAKGRILREILKQNRLEPLPAQCHLAWLIAFNNGYFQNHELNNLSSLLEKIKQKTISSTLSLSSPREQWVENIAEWLAIGLEKAGDNDPTIRT